ncbi:MAG: family 10 glycosylhydrolase, partial [bacterium]|nr:family 10 glycosylhydrolase [Candidatus Minthenecus merdequi]
MKHTIAIIIITIVWLPTLAQKKFEFRGAWIATVANIDWPTQYGLTPDIQRKEMIWLLDSLASLHFNAIIFQVRPTSDAFYKSGIEPWSYYLTGKQDKEPEPFYDPLAFVIYEAHKRNIDVHIWINPYRVLNGGDVGMLSSNHLFFKKPHLFVKYGGKYYFNPGFDETRQYLISVVEDIVRRYDIDAVHFDDYFYPYRVAGEEFPDQATFKNYPRGFKNKDDWRRNNVNMAILEIGQAIKRIKPWVEFGISPFGVWRNSNRDACGSKTTAGTTNYDDLYADVRLWLKKGWIDYVAPQLYWEIGKKAADYKILIEWWNENSFGKNLYIGLYASGL